MPGSAITEYIAQDTYEAFTEITTIFRHDFVQYLGMLHSWMTLIEVEVSETPAAAFASPATQQAFTQAAAKLAQTVADTFHETSARLRPTLPRIDADEQATIAYINTAWGKFYTDFGMYALPRLQTLEQHTRQFISESEFENIIEKNLGAAADEPIQVLLLRCYDRTLNLLHADNFNKRIAEVRQQKNNGTALVL